jgi:hypothetical protein
MTYEATYGGSDVFDLAVRIAGELTLDLLLESRQKLLDDPRTRPGLAVLFDYSDADARHLSMDDVREAAAGAEAQRLGFRAVAVVATDDLTFGLSRMFASLAPDEGSPGPRTVVRSVAEAEEWLRRLDASAGPTKH